MYGHLRLFVQGAQPWPGAPQGTFASSLHNLAVRYYLDRVLEPSYLRSFSRMTFDHYHVPRYRSEAQEGQLIVIVALFPSSSSALVAAAVLSWDHWHNDCGEIAFAVVPFAFAQSW